MKTELSPWERIMLAAKNQKGLRLTTEEIRKLAFDQAIQQRALDDAYERDNP